MSNRQVVSTPNVAPVKFASSREQSVNDRPQTCYMERHIECNGEPSKYLTDSVEAPVLPKWRVDGGPPTGFEGCSVAVYRPVIWEVLSHRGDSGMMVRYRKSEMKPVHPCG